jgi:hypothetical protein
MPGGDAFGHVLRADPPTTSEIEEVPALRLSSRIELVGVGLGLVAIFSRAPLVGVGVHRLDQQSVAYVRDLGVRHIRYTL